MSSYDFPMLVILPTVTGVFTFGTTGRSLNGIDMPIELLVKVTMHSL